MTSKTTAPPNWAEHYTPAHRRQAQDATAWLESHGLKRSWLGRQIKGSEATISQVLSGSYPSDPSHWLTRIAEVMDRHRDRATALKVPYVETSVARVVTAGCRRAHMYRNFSVVSAFVGTGKTEALRRYRDSHANVVMVEADPDMSPGALLMEICDLTGAVAAVRGNRVSRGTTADRFTAVIKALRGTDSLLVVDEAETLQARSLHHIRRIRDKAGIGVVLAGTEYLSSLIRPEHGQFDQIRSRVGFWPDVITGLSRADSDALVHAALGDGADTALLSAVWAYSQGSARVLCEALLPNLHDYGTQQGKALTPDLVHAVAKDVLSLKPRRAA